MVKIGVTRAAVLYNFNNKMYICIDPNTIGENLELKWSWESDPTYATHWVNILELQYFLTDTLIGDPTINLYPWEVQWMYFYKNDKTDIKRF
jgi:hypothetical protein